MVEDLRETVEDAVEDMVDKKNQELVNLGALCVCETLKNELRNDGRQNYTLDDLLEIMSNIEDSIKGGDTEYCEDFCDECGDECDGCAGE